MEMKVELRVSYLSQICFFETYSKRTRFKIAKMEKRIQEIRLEK